MMRRTHASGSRTRAPARRWTLVALAMVVGATALPGCRYEGPTEARVSQAERERLLRKQRENLSERARRREQALEIAARASVEAEAGRTEQAIELYQEALGLWNRMPAAYNNLGALLLEQGDRLGAAEAFRIASELEPRDPRPLTNLGALWTKVGYPDDGMVYFETALDRDPNDLAALRGVVAAADLLRRADERLLEHARRALMIETDPTWRDYLERQRIRIQQDLESY